MQRILGEFKKYNANSRNHRTNDCVVRAISLAYGLSYDETHKLLLNKKNESGNIKYNVYSVFAKLIEDDLGCIGKLTGPNCSLNGDIITLAEFCQQRPDGTYIVLNGEKPSGTDHLAVVIDGDIYDSWDSSKQFVHTVWVIQENKQAEDIFKVDGSQLYQDLVKVLDPFFVQQHKKMPYAEFSYTDLGYGDVAKYGLGIRVFMKIDTGNDMIAYNGTYQKRIVLKLNPRKDYAEQSKQVIEKARVAIREWIYSYRKDIEDLRKMRDLKVNPKFHGSRMLLTKFPDWIVPLVLEAVDNNGNPYTDRYEVFTEALEGDPRKDEAPEVSFYADTIPQLRACFEDYRKNFYRFNYDY